MSTKYRDALASAGAAADQEIGDATAQAAAKDVTISQLQTQGAAKDAAIVDLQAKLDAATHPAPVPIPEPAVIYPGDGKTLTAKDAAGNTVVASITSGKQMQVGTVIHTGTSNVKRAFPNAAGMVVHQIEGDTARQWEYTGPGVTWLQQPYAPAPFDPPAPAPTPAPPPTPAPTPVPVSGACPWLSWRTGIAEQTARDIPDGFFANTLAPTGATHVGLEMDPPPGWGATDPTKWVKDPAKWPRLSQQANALKDVHDAKAAGLGVHFRMFYPDDAWGGAPWANQYKAAWTAYVLDAAHMLATILDPAKDTWCWYNEPHGDPKTMPPIWHAYVAELQPQVRAIVGKLWVAVMPCGWDWLADLKAWTLPTDPYLCGEIHIYDTADYDGQGKPPAKDATGKIIWQPPAAGTRNWLPADTAAIDATFAKYRAVSDQKKLPLLFNETPIWMNQAPNDQQRVNCALGYKGVGKKYDFPLSAWNDQRRYPVQDKNGVIPPALAASGFFDPAK